MTLNMTPKQLAALIENAVKAQLLQVTDLSQIALACEAAGKGAAQALYNVSAEALAEFAELEAA